MQNKQFYQNGNLDFNDPMVQQCMKYLMNQMRMNQMMNPMQMQQMMYQYQMNNMFNNMFMNPMQLQMMYYMVMNQMAQNNQINNMNNVGGNIPQNQNIYNDPNSSGFRGNNNYNSNNNNNNNLVELLPHGDKTIVVGGNQGLIQNRGLINIALNASSGLKVIVPISPESTVNKLILTYAEKVGIPINALGTKIIFLFNGMKLDIYSKEQLKNVFKNAAVITVFDQGGIIGA